jgi:phosphoribosylaminoimidazolecarboxamide formyltransferase/IMP cyclohydrolase
VTKPLREMALLSAYNKDGLESLARAFLSSGLELLATGNTREYLKERGLKVLDVSELTGEPERFNGRLKTLHHKILGGILLRPHQDESEWPYDFRIAAVVCNFYPFKEKGEKCATTKELAEWIDIGGPTMVRAAAKNSEHVWVFTQSGHYARYIASPIDEASRSRTRLALEAFEDVAKLDQEIVRQLTSRFEGESITGQLVYGENPHQKAEFLPSRDRKLKAYGRLSFNNFRDAEAALRFVLPFRSPAVSIVKHQTLCASAAGLKAASARDVFMAAWEGDPVSRFGGVLGFNFTPTSEVTELLAKKFIEVLVMPRDSVSEKWAEDFVSVNAKARVLLVDAALFGAPFENIESFGGVLGTLMQNADRIDGAGSDADLSKLSRLVGEWSAACSKSNAMVLVDTNKDLSIAALAGTGQGQPNRVDALKLLALPRAADYAKRLGRKMSDFVCFSDGFIPFIDTVSVLKEHGIKKLVQPGGSKADEAVKDECKRLGVELELTGVRHFWH